MPDRADIIIIGAGIVGLAIASELAGKGRDVYLLEKNDAFGREQSSRNSEVIHAGIYYENDSLKTKLCTEGNRLLYEICEKHNIPHIGCGKIIVATNDAEAKEIEKLYTKAINNGVTLKMLSRREMAQLEPNMKSIAAFLSPTTGIIDSHTLTKYFHDKAIMNGIQIACKTEVTGIEKLTDGYKLTVNEETGMSSLASSIVINCAGLYSDRIAEMAGIDITAAGYRLNWCRGEYYSIGGGKNRLINRLIYPVPMAISVGVHVCLDIDWRLRFGPLFFYVDELSYKMDDSNKDRILESSIMQALPFVEASDLEPESAGVMAMLQGEGEDFRDFIIRNEQDMGLPGFINLVGIETPGMTSSPAIGKYVSHMVNEILGD